MASRGRNMNTGLRREDAARDRMKEYGFENRVIDKSIKEVLQLYGENQWFLIEDANYAALLCVCLENQEEQANQLAANDRDKKETGKAVMDSEDYAHNSVGGAESSHRGWQSSEDEETNPDEDTDSDDDYDEIIHLTPEPMCEELKKIVRECTRR